MEQWLINLRIAPKDEHLYHLAFLHKSFAREKALSENNERLEFLGDALLTSIISEYLYSNFSELSEGEMTKVRSAYIKRSALNEVAGELDLLQFIKATGNAATSSNSLPGNVLEALLGAIYLDRGYEVAQKFVLVEILPRLASVETVLANDKNYKSRLLEWGQKEHHSIRWSVDQRDEKKEIWFEVAISVNGENVGRAKASSKKKAEQKAAREACEYLEV